MRRVALVGLGAISRIHRRAMRSDTVVVVGGYDPAVGSADFHGQPIPLCSIDELLSLEPDAFIVAVPTEAHHHVIEALLAGRPRGSILVEKPLAASEAEAESLRSEAAHLGCRLGCLYHARYAPEVVWGREKSASLGARVIRTESVFCDPYGTKEESQREHTYGSPWFDSAINALSVLDLFLDVESLRPVSTSSTALTSHTEATPRDGGDPFVDLWCSWQVTSPSKSTRLAYDDGATLILDHQATAGRLFRQGRLVDAFGLDDSVDRLTRHYEGVFDWLNEHDWNPDPELDHRLNRALFALRPS